MMKNKGITLIALVITIVVLIILAAVAINLSLGNNGIFNRAKTAKEQYQNATQYEETEIAGTVNSIEDIIANSRNISTEDIKKIISESCVGFPDYANRTTLTSGTEYTADENMYIIIDTFGLGDKINPSVILSINGTNYRFCSGYTGTDYNHHSESIIPIKKGDVFKLTFSGCNAYKVKMRY